MSRKLSLEIISILFIILFVYAGFAKLLDVEKFRVQIGQSPMLASIAGVTAWAVPLTEIFVAVLLAITRYRAFGLLGSFALMTLFTGYIVSIMQFSDDIPCSCGGVLQSLGWSEHLIFNIAFILLAMTGLVLEATDKGTNVKTLAR